GKGEELLASGVAADRSQEHHHHHHDSGLFGKLGQVADQAGSEFVGMTQVLLLGAGIASATQVLIPRSALTSFGTGIIFAIVAMMSLAFVLSICSTVDAFFALSYANLFPTPALLAFLVFGPM